jgi:CHAT domain-containing protein
LYKRSLAIWEKVLGPEHPDVATSLNNIALLYYTTGRYGEAAPLLQRSLAILEKALGPEHPDVAMSLNNIALLNDTTGRYAEAESLYKRSLAIREKALGPEHPDVAISLNNLAFLDAVINKHPESHKLFLHSFSINDNKREQVFQMLSEKQKIDYMKQNESSVQAFISHSSQYMQTTPDAVAETLNSWLRWKGSVAESQSRYMDAALYSENPDVMTKYEQLISVRRALAKLQLSKPHKLTPAQYKGQIEKLEKQKEALESELSRLSKDFALDRMSGKADINKLSEILPKDSVYIDIANIKMYNFTEKKWGKSRYLAFVLVPGKQSTVRLLDIADAEETDGHIKAYLQEMKRATLYESLPRKEVLEREAKILYGLVMKPLEPYIKGKTLIFISPDGNLNLIPFEVLMTAESRYMMEEFAINYIGAGRDIVRFTDTNVAKEQALIIADPDYDMGLKEEEIVAGELRAAKRVRGAVSKDIRRVKLTTKDIGQERDSVADLEGVTFPRLQDTKHEADAIEKILALDKKASPQNYQDKKAIEEILFAARSPRMLHLATHGYFLQKEEEEPKSGMQLMGRDSDRMPETKMENPMLRSGIVLAGANTSLAEGRDDGIVSAEKILGLKLRGTALVVLSACETGVGDVQTGEGVFGLKRAFILSGAKTVVMSLWSVPSKETTELMTEFYKLMSEGKKKSEALRQAKMNMMSKKPNPYYWGAFVMTGNPD